MLWPAQKIMKHKIELSEDELNAIHRVGRHIKALREGKKISQMELHRLSGVAVDRIRMIEEGTITNPLFSTYLRLLNILGYKLDMRIVTKEYRDDNLCKKCGSPNIEYVTRSGQNFTKCNNCGKSYE